MNSYKFYTNTDCKYFPCHKLDEEAEFNCLFCYCPLYFLKNCGGNYSYYKNGIKNCEKCTIPHQKENYDLINGKIKSFIKKEKLEDQNDIKLIAMDLDHTLLDKEFETDDYTIALFDDLSANGYISVVCTARAYYQAYYFLHLFNPDYVICDNGSQIYDFKKGGKKLLFEKLIPEDAVKAILKELESFEDIFFIVESGADVYINKNKNCLDYVYESVDFFERTKKFDNRLNYHLVDSVKDVPNDIPLTRIYFNDFNDNEELHKSLNNLADKYDGLTYICTFTQAYEFGTSNKGEALNYLINHLNLKKENVMSFGDSLADIPMIKNSGIGIAMNNAVDKLKEEADYVCGSAFDNGVVTFLNEFFSLKKPINKK